MNYISKGKSPKAFEDWKNRGNEEWQPSWNNFQNPEKGIVKEALLMDQGYICCYCGMSIENNSSSEIEHVKPRSECIANDRHKALDYGNLIASCNGSTKEPKPREVHCNNARGDQSLVINPLTMGCEERFSYTLDGNVISSKGSNEVETLINTILHLNAKKIKGFREELVKGLEADFNSKGKDDVLEEIESLSQKHNDRLNAMCFVSISYLQNNFL